MQAAVNGGSLGDIVRGGLDEGWRGGLAGVLTAGTAYGGGKLAGFWRSCFAAGTPLLTPDGDQSIERFRPGDLILARAEHDPSGPVEVKVVEEVFVRTGRVWVKRVSGQEIRTTGEHPVHVAGQGWRIVAELKVGDRLSSHNEVCGVVEEVYNTGTYETVYNLRVADCHTYFVGSEEWGFSVWAHNSYNEEAQGRTVEQHLIETLGDNIITVNGKQTHTINLTNLSKEGRTALTTYLKSLGQEESRGIVYALRDQRTGEVFKVGQSTTGVGYGNDTAVYARFVRGYLRNQRELANQGINVQSEIVLSFVKQTERLPLTPLETNVRQALRAEGHSLLWDNSGPRLRDLNNNIIESGNGITAGLPFKNEALRNNWLERNRLNGVSY
jgi:hypothetical protein